MYGLLLKEASPVEWHPIYALTTRVISWPLVSPSFIFFSLPSANSDVGIRQLSGSLMVCWGFAWPMIRAGNYGE